ncbi:MAG: hypothetical protein HZB53_04525 [Chloroflexi bacterium]|nr:hypothetical protein [Chloroflexota bacterium]
MSTRAHLWRRLAIRVAAAIVVGTICATVPLADWTPHWISRAQMPAAIFGVVVYSGKLLYDTLFYDHYWP